MHSTSALVYTCDNVPGVLVTHSHILFIYLGFYVTFNTVYVISRQVVLWAEEISTHIWLRFCTAKCQP